VLLWAAAVAAAAAPRDPTSPMGDVGRDGADVDQREEDRRSMRIMEQGQERMAQQLAMAGSTGLKMEEQAQQELRELVAQGQQNMAQGQQNMAQQIAAAGGAGLRLEKEGQNTLKRMAQSQKMMAKEISQLMPKNNAQQLLGACQKDLARMQATQAASATTLNMHRLLSPQGKIDLGGNLISHFRD